MEGHSLSSPPEGAFFPPTPIRSLAKEVLQDLALQEDDLLVDLSCGDGQFAEAVLEKVSLRWQIIGVQASRDLLLAATGHVGIRPVPMDLDAFARFPVRYHKAFLRRDQLPSTLPAGLFPRIFHQLIPGGRLVVVEVVPGEDTPLPATALVHWARSRIPRDDVGPALAEVGFSVERRAVDVTCHTPAAECLEAVATRAWPVLEDVPPEELEAGVAELRERLGASPSWTWSARFELVTGKKDEDGEPKGDAHDGSENRGSESRAAR